MESILNVTFVRGNFDEVMQQVVERNRPITVEEDGEPQIVIVPFREYERLMGVYTNDNDE